MCFSYYVIQGFLISTIYSWDMHFTSSIYLFSLSITIILVIIYDFSNLPRNLIADFFIIFLNFLPNSNKLNVSKNRA